MEHELGFKRLTAENWLEPDAATLCFRRLSPISGEFWVPSGKERVYAPFLSWLNTFVALAGPLRFTNSYSTGAEHRCLERYGTFI